MGYNHLTQMLQVVLNFWLNISGNLVVSFIQSTQLVQLGHLVSQESTDLHLVNNPWLKGSYEECLRKGQLSHVNSLSSNPTKWSNTFKQFVGNLPTNCLSVFDHFVILALKGISCQLCSRWCQKCSFSGETPLELIFKNFGNYDVSCK